MPVQNDQLIRVLCCTLLWTTPLVAQESSVPPAAPQTPAAPTSTPAGEGPKTKAPSNAAQLIENLAKEEAQAKARIKEIEGIVFPIQDEIAQKLFFFSPGEFAFLRIQTEAGKTASRFFEAQSRIDQDSWAGVADAFDVAYEAMSAGNFWVGREQSLVAEDAAFFADLNAKVMAAIQKREDGAKIMAMIEERNSLLSRTKSFGPLLKYLGERRLWWQSYPEYMQAVRDGTSGATP